jgi:hypothetical protein
VRGSAAREHSSPAVHRHPTLSLKGEGLREDALMHWCMLTMARELNLVGYEDEDD